MRLGSPNSEAEAVSLLASPVRACLNPQGGFGWPSFFLGGDVWTTNPLRTWKAVAEIGRKSLMAVAGSSRLWIGQLLSNMFNEF